MYFCVLNFDFLFKHNLIPLKKIEKQRIKILPFYIFNVCVNNECYYNASTI